MILEVISGGVRIDNYIKNNSDLSRSKIQELIDMGNVLVNGNATKASYKVKESDIIEITFKEKEMLLLKEDIAFDIIYEDEYLAIINKPSGLVVHPAVGNLSHTLVNGLLYRFNINSDKNIRPGIVHRLDKDTSGVVIVAKDDKTHELLSEMIKEKKVVRKYIALVWGVIKCDKATIDAPIGRDINNRQKYTVTSINSKDAITHFEVIERFNNTTLIMCKLDTGRTHQIRVHLNYIGHPIVNDLVYGNRKIIDENFGQMLHSVSIELTHPITNKRLCFSVDPPLEFEKIKEMLKES